MDHPLNYKGKECNLTTVRYGELAACKRDARHGKPIIGATLALYTDEELIGIDITGEDGKFYFPELLPGEYILRDPNPPVGFPISGGTYKIVVLDDGETRIFDLAGNAIKGACIP